MGCKSVRSIQRRRASYYTWMGNIIHPGSKVQLLSLLYIHYDDTTMSLSVDSVRSSLLTVFSHKSRFDAFRCRNLMHKIIEENIHVNPEITLGNRIKKYIRLQNIQSNDRSTGTIYVLTYITKTTCGTLVRSKIHCLQLTFSLQFV